jgi:plastocyanin
MKHVAPSISRPKGRFTLAIAAAALLGALGATVPSNAVVTGQIVAGPGATLPFGSYATHGATVVLRGNAAVFRNLDIAQHDVRSDTFLFSTPLIGTGKSITVWQVAYLPDGNYPFHCTLHPWMKGKILVRR